MTVPEPMTEAARESRARESRPAEKKRGVSPAVLLLMLLLFALWCLAAVSINRLDRQVKGLESALGEARSSLAAASDEVETLRGALEEKADRDELTEARYVDANMIVKGVAHRGYSSEAPENTLPSFKLALQKGFGYVETDIRFTSDGVPVCLHDDTVDRTSNGSGAIAGMSLAQVRELDFGSWMGEEFAGTKIPTLEEFLSLCRSLGLRPYLELKTGDQAQVRDLVALVKRYGMADDVTWISFSGDLIYYVAHYDPYARLGLLSFQLNPHVITQAQRLRTGYNSVFIGSSSWTAAECLLCVESNIPLEVWTIDEADDLLAMDPYVSGVTSDNLIAGEVLADACLNG